MTRRRLQIAEAEPVYVPDCWYGIADSRHVPRRGRPLVLTRLGRRVVLWRDAGDRLVAMRAACPHRGADLSHGRIVDGEIECPYHGFRFAADGACTTVPCEGPDARIPAHLRMDPLPIREAHGVVWMWHGDAVPSDDLPWLDGMPEASARWATISQAWRASFTRTMEGMLDIHHFPFAHRKLDPVGAAMLDRHRVDLDGERIVQVGELRKPEAPGGPRFAFDCGFPGVVHGRFGSRVRAAVVVCPIDEARTWVWARYAVSTGLGPAIDRVASQLAVWLEFSLVQPADHRLLAGSQPQRSSIEDYALVRADAAIAAWHRLRRLHLRDAVEVDRAAQ